jgi:hypothetical protein
MRGVSQQPSELLWLSGRRLRKRDGGQIVATLLRLLRFAWCEKRHHFWSFSLCLSRACLGKMIVLMYKWLKNGVFRMGR